jgi:hypothetical protein
LFSSINSNCNGNGNALPAAATLSSNSPICSGADAFFTITGTQPNYTGASGTATIGAGGTVNVTVTAVTSKRNFKSY